MHACWDFRLSDSPQVSLYWWFWWIRIVFLGLRSDKWYVGREHRLMGPARWWLESNWSPDAQPRFHRRHCCAFFQRVDFHSFNLWFEFSRWTCQLLVPLCFPSNWCRRTCSRVSKNLRFVPRSRHPYSELLQCIYTDVSTGHTWHSMSIDWHTVWFLFLYLLLSKTYSALVLPRNRSHCLHPMNVDQWGKPNVRRQTFWLWACFLSSLHVGDDFTRHHLSDLRLKIDLCRAEWQILCFAHV